MSENLGKKRVLLLEDSEDTMWDLKEHLEEVLDIVVDLTARASIVDRLRQVRYDLVIVDLMIHVATPVAGQPIDEPNLSFEGVNWLETGLEFLRRLRAGDFSDYSGPGDKGTQPDVPVIVLSAVLGYSVKEKLAALEKQGVVVQDYSEKPYRLDELERKVRTILGV